MSPLRIGRIAAGAAIVVAVAACGEGPKPSHEKREPAPLPAPRTQTEPAPKDTYPKAPNANDVAPADTAPKAAVPKAPSMGDPPVPADPAISAHREFEDAVSVRLAAVDRQITDLAAKVKTAAEDQRVALQMSLDDLSVKRDEASTKLDQIRSIAADKWDAAKTELDKSVGALESAAAEALR